MAAMDSSVNETRRAESDPVLIPQRNISSIKNKIRRKQEYIKLKKAKNKAKLLERKRKKAEYEALGDKAPPKQVPRTLENTREPDETMVDPEDEEVLFDEATDELSSYFRKEKEPKVLITTCDNPHTRTNQFCHELGRIIPNALLRWRTRARVKNVVKQAIEKDFTDILVVNEDRRRPNGLLLIHLPDGPTAYFRLSSVKCRNEIKHSGSLTKHRPEVLLNNFNTRLGHTVARMFASIFHYDPQFHGRRAVTFHNQRDYIFFRHHRYEFRNEKKVGLHELGPSFTLRLKSLQKGTFDTKYGEFEWVLKRHEMETSRRRFFL